MFYRLFSILLFTCFGCALYGQMEEYVKFKNYSSQDFGEDWLTGMCWDQEGGFWAISDLGLIHHNGYYKKVFTYDRSGGKHPLSEQVSSIQFVDETNLWISYSDTFALTHINTSDNSFEHISVKNLIIDSTQIGHVTNMKKSPSGEHWLCTWGAGLIKLNTESPEESVTFILGDTSVHHRAGLFLKDIAFITEDSIFVTFFSGRSHNESYPCYFNPKTTEFERLNVNSLIDHLPEVTQKRIKISVRIVHFVHLDEFGNFWLGTYSGLLHYDRKKGQLNRISEKNEDLNIQNQVNTLRYVESEGELWISTYNKGVMRVNIASRKNNFYYTDPINSESIQSNKVKWISKDKFGNIWVLNGSAGISVYNPYIHNFKMMYWRDMELEYSNRSNQNIPVNQMYVKNSTQVFVSSKIGLSTYNPQEMVVNDSYKFLSIATESGRRRGVGHFKVMEDKIFLNFDSYPHFYFPETKRFVRHTKEYGVGNIAFRHEPKTNKILYYRAHKNNGTKFMDYSNGFDSPPHRWNLDDHIVVSETFSFVTHQGKWIFSEENGRFVILDPSDSTCLLYSPSSTDTYFPDSTVISCLIQDSDEILIGTSSSLYKFNEVTGESEDISNEVGLNEDEGVNSMVIDDEGKIWMALRRELLCWNPKSGEHRRYSKTLGVDASDFLPAIGQKDELGNLYFASMYGILFFHPDDVKMPEDVLESRLFQIRVNERILNQEEVKSMLAGDLEFHWNDNFFEFFFYTNQVLEIAPHQFMYKLEGLNDKWINCGANNHVRFDNLQHGKYKLKFKAVNAYGVESEVVEIPFSIRKPYWLRWWFYVLVGLTFLLLTVVIARQRMRALKRRSELLEETVKERTAEVVEQKKEAERQKAEAEHQKEIVEEKQQEITDSITYAKRIQDAILPADDLFQKLLPDSFIMYRPKDIVAGDFYWMEALNEQEVIFAAADCTGHGVPGAMVSVVCNNALNRTVREFKIYEPGKLLDNTRELVIEQFDQSSNIGETSRDETIKDGMDISLCRLNKKTMKLEWAGANNPLWQVRDGELIEIKGNKQPIGKFDPSAPFDNHVVDVKKGDVFYIFSDGYADQFGGEKGKKFKSTSLKALLLSIHEQPLAKQLERLELEFDNWKGDYEQLDDVCVIGVRL